jgi:hypothetical protein
MGWWSKTKSADSSYSVFSWVPTIFQYLFPTAWAAIVAIAAAYRDWIWNDYGMLGVLVIGLCAGLAASLTLALAGLGFRVFRPRPSETNDRLQANPSGSQNESPAKAGPQYLRNVDFSSHSLSLLHVSLVPSTTVDRLRFYVDASPKRTGIIGLGQTQFRAQIGELKDVVKGQPREIDLVFKGPKSAIAEFYWGDPANNFWVGETNRVRLVIIGPSGSEQHFYFFLIHRGEVFEVIRETDFNWVNEWKEADSK